MTLWSPKNFVLRRPFYLAIVQALEHGIAEGSITAGTQLPPHRELARQLGLSVGTVSKAYSAAERVGLITGEVGRGTFVCRGAEPQTLPGVRSRNDAAVDLSLNVPPPSQAAAVCAAALRQISASDTESLLSYLPHEGLDRHRRSAAAWMSTDAFRPAPENVLICQGAQHAMAIAFGLFAERDTPVLTESLTFSGMKALANYQRLRLIGVATDRHGLVPEALDAACARSGAKLVYTMPTLHSPTGALMPAARREQLAAVIRRRHLLVVEDNVYGFLCPDAPPPLASLVPDLCFYVTSLSKCVAPGLRIGFMVTPPAFRDRMVTAIRATTWMATPIMAEIAARWLADGTVQRLIIEQRHEARARHNIFLKIFGAKLPAEAMPAERAASFHAWLPLAPEISAGALLTRARARGVELTPPQAVTVDQNSPNGLRICLGGPTSRECLTAGLEIVAELLNRPQADPVSFV